uniref:dUTPase-like domain-containing protein n=1 Tax=Vannella robusta TaxID=1487602 RepID=A0A7S4IAR7_9EUKA|mmetsp:Transcript_22953/g.29285  ORF Transcript_22953/g.29285 Transcript_22953/m.29285 type:complete len:230 (+) Transcript_22953:202-891(+)
MEGKYSLLSDKAILRNMEEGNVVIDPFTRENLSTSSYDVTLGQYYFRESMPEPGQGIYNPFSEEMVGRVWGKLQEAETISEWYKRTGGLKLENISDNDRVIWIAPGETILAHTNEFLGGRNSVTTMMKARSSLGRNFIEVCKCAGWGDIGYTNRWTMEITNNSRFYSIPLVVGRRIAQIIFFDSEGTVEGSSYEKTGKYQTTTDMETVKKSWAPTDMLPRMYRDREITK